MKVTGQAATGASPHLGQSEVLFERATQGIVFTDATGRVVAANAAAERILGLTFEQMQGVGDLVAPTVREDGSPLPAAEFPAAVALSTGRPAENVVMGVVEPDGRTVRWLQASAAPVFSLGEDRPSLVCVTFVDVTAQKRTEEALRQEKARLAAALASMTDAVFISDVEGRFIDFNDAFATFHRFKDRAECATNLADYPALIEVFFADGTIAPLDQWAVPRALRGETVTNAEYRLRRKDTGEAWVGAYNFAPIRDEAGAIVGSVCVGRDITERKRAEAALRASEQLYSVVFEKAPFAICLNRSSGNIIVQANEAFAKLVQCPRGDLLGHSSVDLGIADLESRARVAAEFSARGEVNGLEVTRRTRTGEARFLRLHLHPVEVSGEKLVMTTIEDLTARRLAEAEKEKLEAQIVFADRMSAVGVLAASVAHEVNNPLSCVLSSLAEASEAVAALSPARADLLELLREAQTGATQVREVVRSLSVFVHADSERNTPVDVGNVLRFAIGLAKNELRHRARLTINLRETPLVAASTHRLGQVFLNLLINAGHSFGEGPFEANEIVITSLTDELGRVVVEISDTGCGISEENLARIFDPFFTTKEVGSGTGLGLSVSRDIVTSLGGDIQVESQVGKGSTFRVTLPATALREAPARPAPSVPQASRGRVLIVDDEPGVGRATQRQLSKTHEVLTVTSARQALALLEMDGAFDVILCDVMMPDVTGIELYERLRVTSPGLADKMIFMTGGAFTPQSQQFLAEHPARLIEKPCEPSELQKLVQAQIARSRAGA